MLGGSAIAGRSSPSDEPPGPAVLAVPRGELPVSEPEASEEPEPLALAEGPRRRLPAFDPTSLPAPEPELPDSGTSGVSPSVNANGFEFGSVARRGFVLIDNCGVGVERRGSAPPEEPGVPAAAAEPEPVAVRSAENPLLVSNWSR